MQPVHIWPIIDTEQASLPLQLKMYFAEKKR